MKSFLNKILPGSGTTKNFISKDLKRLNAEKLGMGDDAISYVLTGAPETVLSTLSTVGDGGKLAVCRGNFYGVEDNIHVDRPHQFIDMTPFDTALLTRYAQVLAAAHRSTPDRAIGSDSVPITMRIFFTEAVLGAYEPGDGWPMQARKTPVKGLTADRLIEAAHACGGTTADVFELLFWETTHYSTAPTKLYRQAVDLKSLVQAHADDAIKGVANCQAQGREAFLAALKIWKLVQNPPFLAFALDRASDGAKAVREAAIAALRDVPAATIEPLAIAQLAKGTVNLRAGMVEVLLGLQTDSAIAALKSHATTEKTARIVAAIENALSVSDVAQAAGQTADSAAGYVALDGTLVEVPSAKPLEKGPPIKLSEDDRKAIEAIRQAANATITAHNKANNNKKYFYKRPTIKADVIDQVIDFFESEGRLNNDEHLMFNFLLDDAAEWGKKILARLPQEAAIRLGLSYGRELQLWNSIRYEGWFNVPLNNYLSSPDGDLRAIETFVTDLGCKVSLGNWENNTQRKAQKGDLLRTLMPESAYFGGDPDDISPQALWPYLAENFDVLDHALGISSNETFTLDHVRAIKCLAAMPKTPMRYLGALLDVATGERKAGKAEARKMLADVAQVDDRLVTLLDDTRQMIRAGAAEWLGTRQTTQAIPAIKKRLKKEKSELAKAAMLTALQQLGEPLDAYVGPTALLREADAGLKKAKFDKLAWLQLDHLPATKFKNGKKVPADVLRWWIYLGFKLKQSGGNALFDIYLDQLDPASAAAFSEWIFDGWIAYDTAVPSDAEANAHAEKHADQTYKMYLRWDKTFTRERAFAQLRREIKSNYLNSGAATKGILGFATRVPAQIAAAKTTAYLRNHGSRTSQASSLLEVLARKGDPVSLQVVIAAATRLKQKGVQAFAGELVQVVADKMNWSLNELADRTIPVAGLDDDGVLELPCGPDEKLYRATLGDDLTFVLTNPDGKIVKVLSSGQDDATKASKKQLTASKKELKQVVSMQSARLYEGLCAERVWPLADWQRDFRDHPIMRRLIERLVWQGVDSDGQVLGHFRPTAEGEFTDADDAEVDITAFSGVRLAHGAMMDDAQAQQWISHLRDYEVTPLFGQFGRTLMRVNDDQKDETLITDRKGWVTETFVIRGAASKLGYERGAAEDGGWFHQYRKSFQGVGLTAVIDFTGSYLPEENIPAALISLGFEKDNKRRHQVVPLSDVPPVLLSECWNDLHDIAAKAVFDPNWEKNTQW